MNYQSFIILSLIVLCIIAVVIILYRKKKNGKSITCGGNCGSCNGKCSCSDKNKKH